MIITKGLEVEKDPYFEMAYNNKETDLMVYSEVRMWKLKDSKFHLQHRYVLCL